MRAQKCMYIFASRGGASPAAALRLLHYARQVALPYAEPAAAARALLALGLQLFVRCAPAANTYHSPPINLLGPLIVVEQSCLALAPWSALTV